MTLCHSLRHSLASICRVDDERTFIASQHNNVLKLALIVTVHRKLSKKCMQIYLREDEVALLCRLVVQEGPIK